MAKAGEQEAARASFNGLLDGAEELRHTLDLIDDGAVECAYEALGIDALPESGSSSKRQVFVTSDGNFHKGANKTRLNALGAGRIEFPTAAQVLI